MDILYSSYTKVYESKLVPIMDYLSSVWEGKCYPKTDTLHNRIILFSWGPQMYVKCGYPGGYGLDTTECTQATERSTIVEKTGKNGWKQTYQTYTHMGLYKMSTYLVLRS